VGRHLAVFPWFIEIARPKIEFPCADYPIKVIGHASEGFAALVLSIVQRHAQVQNPKDLQCRDSRNGRFVSVQLRITATGPEQLQALNAELRATGRVQMVL